MDREKLVFKALKPADKALGAVVATLRATNTLKYATDGFYELTGKVLKPMFEKNNDLKSEGAENVPAKGGLVFASNHQSWDDVQVIGVTCPRRVRFLAKAEFEHWPILRHMIVLTDSPFIRRGGDTAGMELATRFLQEGKALCIFPEGTIPGEEDRMRHEVDPETGLLPGRTGAIRLAIAARVPIVPVGVSGTGAAFPPELYPRLETLHAPRNVPITVRYGKPISYEQWHGKEVSRDDLRKLTHELMLAISALVDHTRNYVPMKVPMPPLPRYDKVGVLLLHGFTSSVATVEGLVPHLEKRGIPHRVPVLRGHGTVYTDLAGVTAQDWYDDAEKALLDLSREVDRVVVVGLSMGGLMALNLGIRHPDKVAGVVTWAAALRFADPLSGLSPALAKVASTWPSPNAFNDESLKPRSRNYPRFMTDAFVSLLRFASETEKRLPQLTVPVCVLQSKKDTVVAPIAANLIYRDVSSEHREIHWFQRSGHEMGQDCEAEDVFATTLAYIDRFRKTE